MTDSAVWPIEKEMIAIYNADNAWIALVGINKVYSGSAPEGTALPYAILASTSERGTRVFRKSKAGFDNSKTIDLYSDEVGKERCCQMYEITRRLFNGVSLNIDGGHTISGEIRLVTMFTDPSGTEHGVVNFDVVTRND